MQNKTIIVWFVILTLCYWYVRENKIVKNDSRSLASEAQSPANRQANKNFQLIGKAKNKNATVLKPTSEPSVAETSIKFNELRQCYKSESCNFPNNDPREYNLAVGQAIKNELLRLEKYIRENQIQSSEVSHLAAQAMALPDGHVQEAALLLQINQSANAEVLEAVLKNVINSHDGELVPIALAELSKYGDQADRERIESEIIKNLEFGGHFSSKQLAVHLDKLLTVENVQQYQNLASRMPGQSEVRRVIQAKIDEFIRRVQGA